MIISLGQLFAFGAIVGLVFIAIKIIQSYCYKKYWFKGEDGIYKSHFTWRQFFGDLFSGRLFK